MQQESPPHNWNNYPLWNDETAYGHTWVVDQRHPSADDANDGTAEAPFKSVGAAASRARPGERVLIRGGRYRETVRPALGGNGSNAMIHYQGVPGEEAIISGSEVLVSEWTRPRYWMEPFASSTLTASWSRKVWVTSLSDELFKGGYQPFSLKNIEGPEYALMPWTEPVVETPPYTLRRGMLFQDGKRLTQLHHEGDVRRVEGSFWVDVDNRSLHLHPFGRVDPNDALMEVAVREYNFCPESVDLDFIRVSGLTFEHCANGFLRAGTGAVNTRGGQGWIIEDNTIRQANSSGLEFGFEPFERDDPRMRGADPERSNAGGTIVRNNRIHDCGTAGIRSLRVKDARVINNHIWNCAWQEGEFYWECSGIKLLVTERTLVAGNHIHDIGSGTGIWMDWNNRYSRVTRNLIHDVSSQQGAIFIEASRTPGLVDRNIIWNVDGNGIYGGECENQLFLHNFIGRVSGSPVLLKKHTDRSLHGSPLLSGSNTVSCNLFFNTKIPEIQDGEHEFHSNLYLSSLGCLLMNPGEWKGAGAESNPLFAEGEAAFDPASGCLRLEIPERTTLPRPHVPVECDYFNSPWNKEGGTAGPFPATKTRARFRLR